MVMGDAPAAAISMASREAWWLTYCIKRCELLNLIFAALKLGIELCDDLVG
jgi:hypothetical protein